MTRSPKLEWSINARLQSARTWRRGTNKEWAAVGCKKSKGERENVAQIDDRIRVKLITELEIVKEIRSVVLDARARQRLNAEFVPDPAVIL